MATRKLTGSLHAHGCRRCSVRYTDTCAEVSTDGLCTACRGFQPWQELIDNAAPHGCCEQNCRLVTKDEKSIYRLAGAKLWFICRTCARTHPFDPRKKDA